MTTQTTTARIIKDATAAQAATYLEALDAAISSGALEDGLVEAAMETEGGRRHEIVLHRRGTYSVRVEQNSMGYADEIRYRLDGGWAADEANGAGLDPQRDEDREEIEEYVREQVRDGMAVTRAYIAEAVAEQIAKEVENDQRYTEAAYPTATTTTTSTEEEEDAMTTTTTYEGTIRVGYDRSAIIGTIEDTAANLEAVGLAYEASLEEYLEGCYPGATASVETYHRTGVESDVEDEDGNEIDESGIAYAVAAHWDRSCSEKGGWMDAAIAAIEAEEDTTMETTTARPVLVHHHDQNRMQATMDDGTTVVVDQEVYNEQLATTLRELAEERGLIEDGEDVHDLPEDVYDALMAESVAENEEASQWTPDIDGAWVEDADGNVTAGGED